MLRSIGVVIWPTLTNLSTLVLLTIVLSFRPKLSNKANTNRLPQFAFAHTKPQGDYGSHTQKLRLYNFTTTKRAQDVWDYILWKLPSAKTAAALVGRAQFIHWVFVFAHSWFCNLYPLGSQLVKSNRVEMRSRGDSRMWWGCRRQMTHQINRLMGRVIFGEAMSNTLMD